MKIAYRGSVRFLLIIAPMIVCVSCATNQTKLKNTEIQLRKVSSKAQISKNKLEQLEQRFANLRDTDTYLKSHEGMEVFVGNTCITPKQTTPPPKRCPPSWVIRENLREACLTTAICTYGIGVAAEFGNNNRAVIEKLIGNNVATLGCNAGAGFRSDAVDIAIASLSAFFNIDDGVSATIGFAKCMSQRVEQCFDGYEQWRQRPYERKAQCSVVTEPLNTESIDKSEASTRIQAIESSVKSERKNKNNLDKEKSVLEAEAKLLREKLAPRPAGNVPLRF